MTDVARRVDILKQAYDHCFACGRANPVGLHLDGFRIEDGRLRASIAPGPEYQGFAGVLHGGIVATLLDEMGGWTAILLAGVLAVTGTLEVKYRRPARPGENLELEGWIIDVSGARLRLASKARRPEGLVAEATGIYLASGPVPES